MNTHRARGSAARSRDGHLSIVIPVYNERENLVPLMAEIKTVMKRVGTTYEIICVDDGSTDGSLEVLGRLAARDRRIKIVQLMRNYGQTAALAAGFAHARGAVLIPIDADGQNDPVDIPRLLEKLHQGFDVVSGWRRNRKDPWLTRRVPSQIANALIRVLTGVQLHDYGCTLKAYRRNVLEGITLLGEMHRFLPALASWEGARVSEVVVHHRPRLTGQSKYGLGRAYKVILDLITVKFLLTYGTKPLYLFGGLGGVLLGAGLALAGYLVYAKLTIQDFYIIQTPLLLMSALLVLLASQSFLMGLLAEILARVYHEQRQQRSHRVRHTINLP